MEPSRIEVMRHVGKEIDQLSLEYLNPIESNWQPSDFLPDRLKRIADRTRVPQLAYEFKWISR